MASIAKPRGGSTTRRVVSSRRRRPMRMIHPAPEPGVVLSKGEPAADVELWAVGMWLGHGFGLAAARRLAKSYVEAGGTVRVEKYQPEGASR